MIYHFSLVSRLLVTALVAIWLIFPALVVAYDIDEYDDANQFNKAHESKPWLEQVMDLPRYPASEDLTELPEQLVTAALTILVDIDTVAAGEDGVVRYTMALRSRSGAENIFHEGIRCSTAEWKTFAFGSQGKWRARETEWQPLIDMGTGEYRYSLYNQYLCERSGRHLLTKEIQRRLRYGNKTYDD